MKRFSNYAFSIVFMVAAIGCTIPYAKKGTQGFKGGYEDKKLGENHFSIEVLGNSHSTYELLEGYFHRRANELCNGNSYSHTMEKTDTETTETYFAGGFYGATFHIFPVVIGEIHCENLSSHF